MKNKLFAFKHDSEDSYLSYYGGYTPRKKRDMYYYWRGFLSMYSIVNNLSDKEKKLGEKFLLELYYKKKKVRFSNKSNFKLK